MINIITVKHGNNKIYDHNYVNKMYNMISRNLSLPYKFYCLTEDSRGLHTDIHVVPLPVNELKINGWWWKIYMFKPNLFDNDNINFYIDLDMIVMSNIDHYMTYEPNNFIGLRDVAYVFNSKLYTLGSGILRWNNNTQSHLYENFVQRTRNIVSTYHSGGDQAYIWSVARNQIKFFPTEWYESYKWEVEYTKQHKPTSSILVFHGKAKPHNTKHPLISEYWQ